MITAVDATSYSNIKRYQDNWAKTKDYEIERDTVLEDRIGIKYKASKNTGPSNQI